MDTEIAAYLDTQCRALDPATLFTVARTTNRNVVVYAYDAQRVVRVYWRMFEKDPSGSTVEEPTAMEMRMAFGVVRCDRVSDTQHELVIKAAPSKALRVFRRGGAFVVGGQFDHQGPGIVRRIFVVMDESSVMSNVVPRVQECRVYGTSPTGASLELRIPNPDA